MTTSATTLRTLFEQCRDMDASLVERLQALAEGLCRIDKAFSDAVDRIVLRLRQGRAGESAPRVGDPLPLFILPHEAGHLLSLDGLLRNGPAAITFHRGHWCPYCRISMNALGQAQRAIAPGCGQIVAIMPERQRYTTEIKAEASAGFPVLTDMDNGYAMSLNLAFWVDDEMQRFIAEAGRDVPSYQGNDSWVFPIPATFVVGRDGLIKTRFVDPDYRKRMAIDDMLQALAGAQ
jgi:peroxiredoxin